MKILLTSTRSSVGNSLLMRLAQERVRVLQPDLAWDDGAAVAAYLAEQRPAFVINTLAYQDHWQDADWLVNSSHALAAACAQQAVVPLHLSSYRVFGQGGSTGFAEDDDPQPQTERQRAWLAAEQAFAELPRYVVLRLSWLVGVDGDNLFTTLVQQLMQEATLACRRDHRGCPTPSPDVARVTVALLRQLECGADNRGVYHYCTSDACSPYEFADVVRAILEQLTEAPLAALEEEAAPADPEEPDCAVLSCQRIRDDFGVQQRSWRRGLTAGIRYWLEQRGLPLRATTGAG